MNQAAAPARLPRRRLASGTRRKFFLSVFPRAWVGANATSRDTRGHGSVSLRVRIERPGTSDVPDRLKAVGGTCCSSALPTIYRNVLVFMMNIYCHWIKHIIYFYRASKEIDLTAEAEPSLKTVLPEAGPSYHSRAGLVAS